MSFVRSFVCACLCLCACVRVRVRVRVRVKIRVKVKCVRVAFASTRFFIFLPQIIPQKVKTRSSHDIVLLCCQCRDKAQVNEE